MANFEYSRRINARPSIDILDDDSYYTHELPIKINLYGKMLKYTESIYLSASNLSIFNKLQYYNNFEGRGNLSTLYPGFSGQKITNYTIIDNNTLSAVEISDIDIYEIDPQVTFKIIVGNSAGYIFSSEFKLII
jgi:hypothetical protein